MEGEAIRANFLKGVSGSIREEDIESDKENELAEDDGDDAYWASDKERVNNKSDSESTGPAIRP